MSTSKGRLQETALTRRSADLQDYFNPARRSEDSGAPHTLSGSPSADLKLPKVQIVGLTPSQRVFSISTGLNPLSLAITGGDEFFLFMNLRAQHKWASYSMTPSKWVNAANIYNTDLEQLNRRLGHASWATCKTPRALMDKLSDVESMVVRCLAAGDYKCEIQLE